MTSISKEDVKKDVDVILWSMRLASIRRFWKQRFWEEETTQAKYASLIEQSPRLESVAEHSWHVSDTVLLIGRHFPDLDIARCLQIAILHDKLEILIGDLKPLSRSKTGSSTHAFNKDKQNEKLSSEFEALTEYLNLLREDIREEQASLIIDFLQCKTEDAKFVKAVDRIVPLGFIILKKKGDISDSHLDFTLRYAEMATNYFPEIRHFYVELQSRLLSQVANVRNQSISSVRSRFLSRQLILISDDE